MKKYFMMVSVMVLVVVCTLTIATDAFEFERELDAENPKFYKITGLGRKACERYSDKCEYRKQKCRVKKNSLDQVPEDRDGNIVVNCNNGCQGECNNLANEILQNHPQTYDEPYKALVQSCLDDISNCPVYGDEVDNSYEDCHFEVKEYITECRDLCYQLFEPSTRKSWGEKVLASCDIGCKYAKATIEEMGDDSDLDSCFDRCTTTVWNRKKDAGRCRWKAGLGLNVWELKNFGAGKSCRIGCILGMFQYYGAQTE